MADEAKRRSLSAEQKVRVLTTTYARLLQRYERLEALSLREKKLLQESAAMSEINALLSEKREILREVQQEEKEVVTAREWWQRARHTLPPRSGRELLSILDAISERIERSLSLETECRDLLTETLSWGRPGGAPGRVHTLAAKAPSAVAAYGKNSPAAEGSSR